MPAFLKNIEPYIGDGSRNEKGQTLEEFLEEYDPKKYENPCMTADVLVVRHPVPFTEVERGLKVLMVKRRNHPSIGFWALPGGFVEIKEDLDLAAKRELQEETGLTDVEVALVTTYGDVTRDPRARVITASYVALVDESVAIQAGDDAADAAFMDVSMDFVESSEQNGVCKEIYRIKLLNNNRNVSLEADVESWYNVKGILRDRKYRVVNSRGIAFDHARSIVQTLLFLRGLCEK